MAKEKKLSFRDALAAKAKHAEWLTAKNAEFDNWRSTCRRCGAQRVGALADLKKEHDCGAQSSS